MNKKLIIGICILALLITGCNKECEDEDAKCVAELLAEQGAVYYISEGCTHCNHQKSDFGEYFDLIESVDCREESQKCADSNIKGVPTLIVDNKQYTGYKSLEELKKLFEESKSVDICIEGGERCSPEKEGVKQECRDGKWVDWQSTIDCT